MTDICFLDTEVLGLDPDAPIWEFAAVRRDAYGDSTAHLLIRHEPGDYLGTLPEKFAADYRARYSDDRANPEPVAAAVIHGVTRGAHMVACNPVFDEPRLARLLRRNGIEPEWHYHPDDISSIAKGYLAARGELPDPPHKSEVLAEALGVVTADYARHTALGDVQWLVAQWDAVMHPASKPSAPVDYSSCGGAVWEGPE